jgi:hypothetical protein
MRTAPAARRRPPPEQRVVIGCDDAREQPFPGRPRLARACPEHRGADLRPAPRVRRSVRSRRNRGEFMPTALGRTPAVLREPLTSSANAPTVVPLPVRRRWVIPRSPRRTIATTVAEVHWLVRALAAKADARADPMPRPQELVGQERRSKRPTLPARFRQIEPVRNTPSSQPSTSARNWLRATRLSCAGALPSAA